MQSVPITTKVVSSNPVHGEAYSIQHYVIKSVSGWWFFQVIRPYPVSSTSKTDHHNITEILLKVTLSTINLNLVLSDIASLFSLKYQLLPRIPAIVKAIDNVNYCLVN